MIIGVTGMHCAGKDTAGELLAKKGFIHCSLSDNIRKVLIGEGKELIRYNIINKGDELRKIHGPSVLAQMTLQTMQEGKDYIVTSFRNPAEVEAFRQRKDFILLKIDASLETRFERFKKRGSKEDTAIQTIEDFKKMQEREMSTDSLSQQLHTVIKMADVTLMNDSDVETLNNKLTMLIMKLRKAY